MDSGNVIVGSGIMYTAPKGTALPTLTTKPTPSTWASASFTASGYTDDGVTYTYTPTFKLIEVDESMSPIDIRLIGEKLEITVKLAEVTLLNLKASIAGSTLTENATTSTLTLGNPTDPSQGEIVLAFQGPAPTTIVPTGVDARVFVVYRAKSTAAVSYHAQRKDKVVVTVKFEALADSTKAAGNQLSEIIDYTPSGS
jgi:hypothetical protein